MEATDQGTTTLSIVTPRGEVFEGSVEMATLPGTEGEFGVLPGHAPFFSSLRPGLVRFEEGGMPRSFLLSAGYVEVIPERIVVLARTCETRDDVDRQKAVDDKAAFEKELSGLAEEAPERARIMEKIALADARIAFVDGGLEAE